MVGCDGCAKAHDSGQSLRLAGGWSVGHYGGGEGFLGWLALQTVEHRLGLTDLTLDEAARLGPILHGLEKGVYNYWQSRDRPIGRVYVMYFLEGLLEKKRTNGRWHLHFHIVPRFEELKPSMSGKKDVLGDTISGVDAYLIAKLRANRREFQLPSDLDRKTVEMAYGRGELQRREFAIVQGVVWASGLSASW